jgi:uncharacterized repeat protein (TIGR04076 family)
MEPETNPGAEILEKPCNVKITVLKRLKTGEILEEYGKGAPAECPMFREGQQFMVQELNMPQGFCSWAWADIQRDITVLGLRGEFYWIKKKGMMISCCTDGLSPVVFKLERME